MIVCVCKRVSERELEAAIAGGADSVQALSRVTGCGTQCGRCIPTVREMLTIDCTRVPELRPLPEVPMAGMMSL